MFFCSFLTSHPASPQVLPPPWDIVLPALAKAGLPILDPQYSALLERHCGPGLNYAGTWGSFGYHLSFDGLHLIQSIHPGCGRRGQFRTPHQDGPVQRAPRVRWISRPAHLEVECSRAGRVIRPIGGKATGSWVGQGVRHMYSFIHLIPVVAVSCSCLPYLFYFGTSQTECKMPIHLMLLTGRCRLEI